MRRFVTPRTFPGIVPGTAKDRSNTTQNRIMFGRGWNWLSSEGCRTQGVRELTAIFDPVPDRMTSHGSDEMSLIARAPWNLTVMYVPVAEGSKAPVPN